ncbi:MAG: hypothetical protein J5I93_07250 [Pirellulaceae bacterium]|nr:hypothetical protein [Pirellulaceae bacterium]
MSDLEDFMRRAAEHRARLQRPEIEILEPAEVELVDAEIVRAMPVGVDSHVASHINTREFTERASHLGEQVGQADDNLEARLQATFDHRVGSLRTHPGTVAPVAADQPFTPTNPWLKLLSSPENLRQAIVLGEILQPPRDRW